MLFFLLLWVIMLYFFLTITFTPASVVMAPVSTLNVIVTQPPIPDEGVFTRQGDPHTQGENYGHSHLARREVVG